MFYKIEFDGCRPKKLIGAAVGVTKDVASFLGSTLSQLLVALCIVLLIILGQCCHTQYRDSSYPEVNILRQLSCPVDDNYLDRFVVIKPQTLKFT